MNIGSIIAKQRDFRSSDQIIPNTALAFVPIISSSTGSIANRVAKRLKFVKTRTRKMPSHYRIVLNRTRERILDSFEAEMFQTFRQAASEGDVLNPCPWTEILFIVL
jgi:hypothetical protein